jgi:esterase FrsA
LEKAQFAIEKLIDKGYIVREKVGLMGLSRGGLIASLVATRVDARAIAGFAPMTDLCFAKEFDGTEDLAKSYTLENYLDPLCEKAIRYYIGNRDVRVGTDKCFSLVLKLADAAHEKGKRSPPVELIVSPSIGHMGHGTGKETFEAGADWVGKKLGAIH